jgi:hypothetical protein
MSQHVVHITIEIQTGPTSGTYWTVSADALGADDMPFRDVYDSARSAEDVAHAIGGILRGLGRRSDINGCSCSGDHHL